MTTEQKAVDLINEVRGERKLPPFSIEVISRHTNDWDEALCRAIEAIEAKDAEIERLREALERIADGTMPRPLGEPWRMDMASSKHDRCVHGAWMYEPCEGCIDAFIAAALKETGQ